MKIANQNIIDMPASKAEVCVELTFSCETRLVYRLNHSWTAQYWASLLAKMQPQFLRRMDVNHKHGFASPAEVRSALARLQRCINKLGFSLEPLSRSDWQSALNQLHVNFPEFFKQDRNLQESQLAHEMNLLIHWLEYELPNYFQEKKQYIFNLDFNHFPPAYRLKQKFPDSELRYFSPKLDFGNLHLHYIYIGRHYLEMFDARDRVSPPHHFRAQHEFNATCGLVFSEPVDEVQLKREMLEYYVQRGGKKFFGFDFHDEKLAIGFFKLGQLENLDSYSTTAHRGNLRDRLKDSHIVKWEVLQSRQYAPPRLPS